jgi:hypothetical protein
METRSLDAKINREPRTLLLSVGRKHIAEGAGFESKPSWLPLNKTRTLGNSLRTGNKNVNICNASAIRLLEAQLIRLI